MLRIRCVCLRCQSFGQSNPRALPSHVRRWRRIPAKPPSHISSRSMEVLSQMPRCASRWRDKFLCARKRRWRKSTSWSGRSSARWRTFPTSSRDKEFPYFKTPPRFWEHSLSCGAVSVATQLSPTTSHPSEWYRSGPAKACGFRRVRISETKSPHRRQIRGLPAQEPYPRPMRR